MMIFSNAIAGIWFFFLLVPGIVKNVTAQSTASSDTLQQVVDEGRMLFTGKTPLSGGGPSCISCHSINDPTLPISGGKLAINITVFGALPGAALRTFIEDSPFPVMNSAFVSYPLTEEEVSTLIAYLQHVSAEGVTEPSGFPENLQFLWTGLAGLIIILFCIWALWRKRKHGSVNKRIYQRQIQSV